MSVILRRLGDPAKPRLALSHGNGLAIDGYWPFWRLLLITGFLGGLTTFSTFSAESVALMADGAWGAALLHTSLHLVGSLAATAAGVFTLKLADTVFIASSGGIGPFRYVILYNGTTSGLIGFYDYGSSVTLNATDTFTSDFDDVNGVFTVS